LEAPAEPEKTNDDMPVDEPKEQEQPADKSNDNMETDEKVEDAAPVAQEEEKKEEEAAPVAQEEEKKEEEAAAPVAQKKKGKFAAPQNFQETSPIHYPLLHPSPQFTKKCGRFDGSCDV